MQSKIGRHRFLCVAKKLSLLALVLVTGCATTGPPALELRDGDVAESYGEIRRLTKRVASVARKGSRLNFGAPDAPARAAAISNEIGLLNTKRTELFRELLTTASEATSEQRRLDALLAIKGVLSVTDIGKHINGSYETAFFTGNFDGLSRVLHLPAKEIRTTLATVKEQSTSEAIAEAIADIEMILSTAP